MKARSIAGPQDSILAPRLESGLTSPTLLGSHFRRRVLCFFACGSNH